MKKSLDEILAYESESHSIDFKKEQYPVKKDAKKHEFLKDISAMANHPSDEDKYIIIGVKEGNGVASEFYEVTNLIDEAKYRQYLNTNIEPKINFEYKSFMHKGFRLAYFRIFENMDRPYLFKKVVRNSIDQGKIEFREGDGFIRTGTSTKKLTREDFDIIYENKYQKKDRKHDLIVTPYKGVPESEDFSGVDLKYIDVSIENISNQSIDLDIEMKVYKGKDYGLMSEEDFRKELAKQKRGNSGPFMLHSTAVELPNIHVNVESYEDYIYLRHIKMRHEKTALSIPQKSTEEDVFGQSLLLYEEEPIPIELEIAIRSDDFTDGIWRKNYKLEVEYE